MSSEESNKTSPQTPSVGFNFEVVLDKEKETDIQKIKRWIRKQKPPLNIILEHLFSFVEKWYIDWKVNETMRDVDRQAEEIVKQWEEEDEKNRPKAEIVEEGLFGEEGWSISISNPVVERGSEAADGRMGTGSDEKRLGRPLPDPWG
jgi:hypothetical protein